MAPFVDPVVLFQAVAAAGRFDELKHPHRIGPRPGRRRETAFHQGYPHQVLRQALLPENFLARDHVIPRPVELDLEALVFLHAVLPGP